MQNNTHNENIFKRPVTKKNLLGVAIAGVLFVAMMIFRAYYPMHPLVKIFLAEKRYVVTWLIFGTLLALLVDRFEKWLKSRKMK